MKNLVIAPLLVFAALALAGCFFPGGYHDRDHYGGGYGRPEGPPPGPYIGGGGEYQHPAGGYHEGP